MERAYREDELLGATIIDSEGYVYGKVEKISITEDEIILLAYEEKPDVKTVVDADNLKETLLKDVKKSIGLKLRGITPNDTLTENIRKELGLRLDEKLSDEHYEKYAERLSLPLPLTKATIDRREEKGTVTLNEVKTMKVTVIGKEKWTKTVKVILLHEPREAVFRRIPVQKKVPYRNTDVLKDKLVLDSDGKALGYVDSVVLFQEMPGIRVYVSRVSGQVSLSMLARYLEESGKSDAAGLLRKHFADYPDSHRYTLTLDELDDFMNSTKISFVLPENIITNQGTRDLVADIPWDAINKIGDVVLLKSTLTDLRSKGYIQGL